VLDEASFKPLTTTLPAGSSTNPVDGRYFALLAPQRVRTLTVICSRDTPFPGVRHRPFRKLRDISGTDGGFTAAASPALTA
jgi:hypothetical protein